MTFTQINVTSEAGAASRGFIPAPSRRQIRAQCLGYPHGRPAHEAAGPVSEEAGPGRDVKGHTVVGGRAEFKHRPTCPQRWPSLQRRGGTHSKACCPWAPMAVRSRLATSILAEFQGPRVAVVGFGGDGGWRLTGGLVSVCSGHGRGRALARELHRPHQPLEPLLHQLRPGHLHAGLQRQRPLLARTGEPPLRPAALQRGHPSAHQGGSPPRAAGRASRAPQGSWALSLAPQLSQGAAVKWG